MFRLNPHAVSVVALAAAAAFICAPAQAQLTKVIPLSATSSEGAQASVFPFKGNAVRFQQLWNGPDVTAGVAVLTSINFRRDGNNTAYAKIDIPQLKVTIGHTSVSPLTMTTTFSTNITSTMTTVVNGKYTVPAQAGVSKPPAAFNIKFPTSTPYIYNPKNGHLIMEWIAGSGNLDIT